MACHEVKRSLYFMVGVVGLEPTTSCSQSMRDSQLRYTPKYMLRMTSG